MDQRTPTRDREIDAAFISARPWLRRLEVKRGFDRDQRMEFEGTLYAWFRLFARRPGCVERPMRPIRWSLIRMAYRAARAMDEAAGMRGHA
jgi:hypothetical protein